MVIGLIVKGNDSITRQQTKLYNTLANFFSILKWKSYISDVTVRVHSRRYYFFEIPLYDKDQVWFVSFKVQY